jgi:murein DD-endopeptidase MepM/ murein hydrolase activator NlpD
VQKRVLVTAVPLSNYKDSRVKQRISDKINGHLDRYLPEQRLFLKSEQGTRFVRLRPATQAIAMLGSALFVGWTVIVTAFFLLGTISAGSSRDQVARSQDVYETRLNALSMERNARAKEAEQALERFYVALEQVSQMQEILLASEDRRRELETGIEVIQATLRRTIKERDEARDRSDMMLAELEQATGSKRTTTGRITDAESTVAFLTEALDEVALERDEAAVVASSAEAETRRLEAEARIVADRNAQIFAQLEEAVEVSFKPLRKVFNAAGMPTDSILREVRRGYTGQGGPLTPISFSTRGAAIDAETARANAILSRMQEVDMFRIAAERAPLDHPVRGSFRTTSGYGPRWGRMHSGLDFAGAHGTDIVATADGVVTHAGWGSGYGKMVKVRHDFGFETLYAHMTTIRVQVGQRVSRGQHIGDMGSTGRSTGTHLHYEIRNGGNAVNPKPFVNAGSNVF